MKNLEEKIKIMRAKRIGWYSIWTRLLEDGATEEEIYSAVKRYLKKSRGKK